MNDKIAITGAGIVCSLGHSSTGVWDALDSGRTGINLIEGFNTEGFACRFAAQVKDLKPADMNIHPRDARIMDKHSYMLMKCTRDAWSNAGLEKMSVPGEDVGLFAGMGMVDYNIEDLMPAVMKSINSEGDIDYDRFYSSGFLEIHPLWPLSMLNNITFCQVAISLGIRGENTVFSPHADSGAQAIAEGMMTLREKKARVILAGGVSEKVSPLSLARGHLTGILAADNKCRPFSQNRQGTILGEGCGMLALELRSSADERGAAYTALLTGYGAGFELEDGYPGPSAQAIAVAMEKALTDAGLHPSDIDLVITNGDGTLRGDRNEMEALSSIFPEAFAADFDNPVLFSSKPALGNLLAGAPAVDIILGMRMIEHGIIPATGVESGPENIMSRRIKHPKRIISNCQSYEGQCASFIIEAV